MADIIQLLPDSIANQIAAGEVVQRPASVVKELLENAIDAGGSRIRLILKDAGKQLIQVIDNGCGMSETDARMSFERHATSKISRTEDLYAIRTLGFRGEALASIAAVAQVELKSRRHEQDTGTHIVIEGSRVIKQEACETPQGSNILVKNLFYNVPARRKFLKTNTVELRHILDEFQRIAVANATIHFEVFHNDTELYHLPVDPLRKRIVSLFGKAMNNKLVPLNEDADICRLKGFIGKPEAGKRNRGEQFLIVNGRFIKSPYIHHAIASAYQKILPQGTHPFYALRLSIDSERIDVNVHPTKQEIKFEDERIIYNVMQASVRRALSQNNITPSLDFDQNPALAQVTSRSVDNRDKVIIPSSFSTDPKQDVRGWQDLYEGLQKQGGSVVEAQLSDQTIISQGGIASDRKEPYQVHQAYIISQIKSGFLIIDQQYAHQRILYEQYLINLKSQPASTQKLLFPKSLHLSTHDSTILTQLLDGVKRLGFEIEDFGQESFVLHGIPSHLSSITDEASLIQEMLEQFEQNVDLDWTEEQRLAWSLSKSASLKRGTALTSMEMESLIDQLFACEVPFQNPAGHKCFITIDLQDLESKFR
ncbi:MAG: DNA mismatch repair endonuclease MutL [Saprospiraceae bacterium]|nr:DNA mismatch repair endonuclease MutL [Saprospiraceae bacterium]